MCIIILGMIETRGKEVVVECDICMIGTTRRGPDVGCNMWRDESVVYNPLSHLDQRMSRAFLSPCSVVLF